MTSTNRIHFEGAPESVHPSSFHVLVVGECKAVKPLLVSIPSTGPSIELHSYLPDDSGLCALHGQMLDLIFVDADSSHYCAARLCQSFKLDPETRAVPLIVVSCSAKACVKSLGKGADDFATPETLPALLFKRIAALVHVRQARDILRFEYESQLAPQFPPFEWRDPLALEDPLSRSQSDYEPAARVDLPAVKKEDVKVTLDQGVLTIFGDRRQQTGDKNEKFHRVESFYGSFERSFSPPDNVNSDTVSCDTKDGTLTVHIPKIETLQKKPKQITAQQNS